MNFNHWRDATRGVGDALIIKRRQRENNVAKLVHAISDSNNQCHRANWEQNVQSKDRAAKIHQTYSKLKNQQESQLHARRIRLAELYNRELEEWTEACAASIETPEDRKQKMIQRAKELKTRRERERRELAEQKRLQQYRESSDDLRVRDSRKLQVLTLEERSQQLIERERILDDEHKYEEEMARLWERDRLLKEERERVDHDNVVKSNEQVRNILDLQVDLVRKRREEEKKLRDLEDSSLLKEWSEQKRAQDALENAKRARELQRALDVKKFNVERAENAQRETENERQYDLRLLEQALTKETEDRRIEQDTQRKYKEEQLSYQRMLKKQMELEAEDVSEADKLRKELEDQVWKRQDDHHMAEEAARQELLREVLNTRKKQVASKQFQKQQAKEAEMKHMEQIKLEGEEALQKELREQEEKRREQKKTQMDVLYQQKEKKMEEQLKKQNEYLQLTRMQFAEKKHKETVAKLAEQAPRTNFRRKTSQWYFDS
ncbi:hypothetical protein ABG067_000515 [Albugo candida]